AAPISHLTIYPFVSSIPSSTPPTSTLRSTHLNQTHCQNPPHSPKDLAIDACISAPLSSATSSATRITIPPYRPPRLQPLSARSSISSLRLTKSSLLRSLRRKRMTCIQATSSGRDPILQGTARWLANQQPMSPRPLPKTQTPSPTTETSLATAGRVRARMSPRCLAHAQFLARVSVVASSSPPPSFPVFAPSGPLSPSTPIVCLHSNMLSRRLG
ncbi:hypothetical protein RB213_004610, partial [Colletotrichum asianum]